MNELLHFTFLNIFKNTQFFNSRNLHKTLNISRIKIFIKKVINKVVKSGKKW